MRNGNQNKYGRKYESNDKDEEYSKEQKGCNCISQHYKISIRFYYSFDVIEYKGMFDLDFEQMFRSITIGNNKSNYDEKQSKIRMNWEKKGNENKREKRMRIREKKRINCKRRKEEKA